MQDYVRMYHNNVSNQGYENLVSEVFVREDDANVFAQVFTHNYKVKAYVRETYTNGEYVVFADNVELSLIRANYDTTIQAYVFATWSYLAR